MEITAAQRGLSQWDDELIVETTNESRPEIRVPVRVYESRPIEVSPRLLVIGAGKKRGVGAAYRVELRGRQGHHELRSTSVEAPSWLEVEAVKCDHREILAFTAMLSQRYDGGNKEGKITIYLSEPPHVVEVPVMVIGQGQ
jgi:hypothetical protein